MNLIEMPFSDDQKKFQEGQAAFIETCAMIRTAWKAIGYPDDPIARLVTAVYAISVYGHILSEDT